MLLSEVALGNMCEKYQAEFTTFKMISKDFQSVKGVGMSGPDFNDNIVL